MNNEMYLIIDGNFLYVDDQNQPRRGGNIGNRINAFQMIEEFNKSLYLESHRLKRKRKKEKNEKDVEKGKEKQLEPDTRKMEIEIIEEEMTLEQWCFFKKIIGYKKPKVN